MFCQMKIAPVKYIVVEYNIISIEDSNIKQITLFFYVHNGYRTI